MLGADSASIKGSRAKLLGQSAKLEFERKLNSIKGEISNLELKKSTHTDLAPSTTIDLAQNKNFNPVEWVNELLKIEEQLVELNVQLEIAQKSYNEWFADESISGK